MRMPLQSFGAAGGLVAALLFSACSAEPPAAAPAKGAAAAAQPSTIAAKDVSAPPALKSVFTVDPNLRDPFFPNKKRAQATARATGGAAPAPAVDVIAQLRAGFYNVYSAGNRRVALINDAVLERGQTTVVSLPGPGPREVRVRVIDVLADGVVLEIPGHGRVTISQPRR